MHEALAFVFSKLETPVSFFLDLAFVQLVYKEPDERPEVHRQYSASMRQCHAWWLALYLVSW